MRLAAALCVACAAPAAADGIAAARFADPTDRYAHAVLGDALEWGALEIEGTGGQRWRITLPEDQVFEDLAPRLWDVTGDGAPEVVVVLTRADLGSALVVLGLVDGAVQQIAATPHIGQTNRWLAPVAAADLDGDGAVEIAYVDRPHLAKTLRVWRYDDGDFREVANLAGVSNHRIGQDFIQGGLRACGAGPEMVLADGGWREVVAVTFRDGALRSRALAPYAGPESIAAALDCPAGG